MKKDENPARVTLGEKSKRAVSSISEGLEQPKVVGIRRKLAGMGVLSALLIWATAWLWENIHTALACLAAAVGALLLYWLWNNSHLISKRLNLFSMDMETESRDKQPLLASDIKDHTMLVSVVSEKQEQAVRRHMKAPKYGIPVLSKPATDYVLGRRMIKKTIWNDNFADPMVGFVGEIGSGKTMAMIEAAMKLRGEGFIIIGNDEGLGADYVYTSLEEMYELIDLSVVESYKRGGPPDRHTLILFDEIQNTFDSRDFKNFDPFTWARVTQRRKYGFRFMWTAPREEYVDKRIRQMTKWVWHCSVTPLLKRFKRECFPPMEETTIGERPRHVTKTWLRENVVGNDDKGIKGEFNSYAFVSAFSKNGPDVKGSIVGRVEQAKEKEGREQDEQQ